MEICSTKSKLIGLRMVPKPLALRPKGSLKLTPSMAKSLNLLFAPITDISVYRLEALLTDTLGSIFAKSPIDLFIVGIASICDLVNRVPVPVLTIPEPASAVTTSSSAADLERFADTRSTSPRTRNTPSSLSV